MLLRIARDSIAATLQQRIPDPAGGEPFAGRLAAPGAAFVSLHHGERLRGCIGTIDAERPLHATVAHAARSAAFADPRFPPLTANELGTVCIEISRLSPLLPATIEDIRVGVHGVCLCHHDQRAVFLPQVALRFNWDAATLLSELCFKACIPGDAWQQPDTQLLVFEADVFSDAPHGVSG